MKGLLGVVAVVVVGFVLYLYFKQSGGAPAGVGSGANDAINSGKNAVGGTAENIYHQPWFWTAAVAGGLAVLGTITWKKIGGFGRAVVLVAAAVTVTIIVARLHG